MTAYTVIEASVHEFPFFPHSTCNPAMSAARKATAAKVMK